MLWEERRKGQLTLVVKGGEGANMTRKMMLQGRRAGMGMAQ